MYPILQAIELPMLDWIIHLRAYPTMHVIALVVVVALTLRLYSRDIGSPWPALDPFLVGVPAGMLGAVALAGWTSEMPLRNPLEFPIFWQIGPKASYGGLLAGTFAAAVTARLRGLPVTRFLDTAAIAVAFGIAIGRIGCFLGGCCWGHPTNSFLGVRFPDGHNAMSILPEGATGVHATQLYLAAAAFVTGIVLLQVRRRGAAPGVRFRLFVALYATGILGIEFLRNDPGRWFMGGMSHSQWISLALIVCLGVFHVFRRLRPRLDIPATSSATTGLWFAVAVSASLVTLSAKADEVPIDLLDLLSAASAENPTGGIELAPGEGGWIGTQAHLLAGTFALLDGDVDRGIVEFREATRADPGTPWSAQAELAYGISLLAVGDRSEASRAFATASLQGRGDVAATSEIFLGRMRMADGDPRAAEDHFRRVMDQHRNSSLADDASLGLAQSLVSQNRNAEAVELLERAQTRYGENPLYANALYDERLAWDRLEELSPEQLAALLQSKIDLSMSERGNPFKKFVGVFSDQAAAAEIEAFRRELERSSGEKRVTPEIGLAGIGSATFASDPQEPSVETGREPGGGFLAAAVLGLALAAVIPIWRHQRR